MCERREAVQHVQQVGRAELGRSTGSGYLLCEPEELRSLAAGDLRHRDTNALDLVFLHKCRKHVRCH